MKADNPSNEPFLRVLRAFTRGKGDPFDDRRGAHRNDPLATRWTTEERTCARRLAKRSGAAAVLTRTVDRQAEAAA